MARDQFQVVGDTLTGHGLAFDVVTIGAARQDRDKLGVLADMANAIYRQGRESAILASADVRFDLHGAAEALRALAVIVGPTPTGDRYRRGADLITRLLQDHEGGG